MLDLQDPLRDRQGDEFGAFVDLSDSHHVRYVAFNGGFAEVQDGLCKTPSTACPQYEEYTVIDQVFA